MTEAAQAVAAPKRDSMVRRWFANWRKKRAKRKKLTLGERLVAIFTGPRFIAFVLLAVFIFFNMLIGIMVNNDYCLILGNFRPSQTIQAGPDLAQPGAGALFTDLAARWQRLPFRLQ